jgi:hypothetical protein
VVRITIGGGVCDETWFIDIHHSRSPLSIIYPISHRRSFGSSHNYGHYVDAQSMVPSYVKEMVGHASTTPYGYDDMDPRGST